MSNMNQTNLIIFKASGTPVTFTPPPSYAGPGTFALPAYDSGNLDLVLTSNSGSPIIISFAGGGCTVKPGQQVLLTSNPAVLATNTNPAAMSMSAGGATATSCTAMQDTNMGSITITRGTATANPVF